MRFLVVCGCFDEKRQRCSRFLFIYRYDMTVSMQLLSPTVEDHREQVVSASNDDIRQLLVCCSPMHRYLRVIRPFRLTAAHAQAFGRLPSVGHFVEQSGQATKCGGRSPDRNALLDISIVENQFARPYTENVISGQCSGLQFVVKEALSLERPLLGKLPLFDDIERDCLKRDDFERGKIERDYLERVKLESDDFERDCLEGDTIERDSFEREDNDRPSEESPKKSKARRTFVNGPASELPPHIDGFRGPESFDSSAQSQADCAREEHVVVESLGSLDDDEQDIEGSPAPEAKAPAGLKEESHKNNMTDIGETRDQGECQATARQDEDAQSMPQEQVLEQPSEEGQLGNGAQGVFDAARGALDHLIQSSNSHRLPQMTPSEMDQALLRITNTHKDMLKKINIDVSFACDPAADSAVPAAPVDFSSEPFAVDPNLVTRWVSLLQTYSRMHPPTTPPRRNSTHRPSRTRHNMRPSRHRSDAVNHQNIGDGFHVNNRTFFRNLPNRPRTMEGGGDGPDVFVWSRQRVPLVYATFPRHMMDERSFYMRELPVAGLAMSDGAIVVSLPPNVRNSRLAGNSARPSSSAAANPLGMQAPRDDTTSRPVRPSNSAASEVNQGLAPNDQRPPKQARCRSIYTLSNSRPQDVLQQPYRAYIKRVLQAFADDDGVIATILQESVENTWQGQAKTNEETLCEDILKGPQKVSNELVRLSGDTPPNHATIIRLNRQLLPLWWQLVNALPLDQCYPESSVVSLGGSQGLAGILCVTGAQALRPSLERPLKDFQRLLDVIGEFIRGHDSLLTRGVDSFELDQGYSASQFLLDYCGNTPLDYRHVVAMRSILGPRIYEVLMDYFRIQWVRCCRMEFETEQGN